MSVTPVQMLQEASGVILVAGGVGLTASAFVDATKVLKGGGASRFGFQYIRDAMKPFAGCMGDCGIAWESATLARWINGETKDDQRRALKDIILMGVTPVGAIDDKGAARVAAVAKACRLEAEPLTKLVVALAADAPLDESQKSLLGRLNNNLSVEIDAAFERADQRYRNVSKLLAGVIAVGLSVWGGLYLVPEIDFKKDPAPGLREYLSYYFPLSILFGLAAVPLAPMSKDIASALKAGADAVKAGRSSNDKKESKEKKDSDGNS